MKCPHCNENTTFHAEVSRSRCSEWDCPINLNENGQPEIDYNSGEEQEADEHIENEVVICDGCGEQLEDGLEDIVLE